MGVPAFRGPETTTGLFFTNSTDSPPAVWRRVFGSLKTQSLFFAGIQSNRSRNGFLLLSYGGAAVDDEVGAVERAGLGHAHRDEFDLAVGQRVLGIKPVGRD